MRFELGQIERRSDIAPALLRVARAIAEGSLDARRGRLITEGLRASHAAWDSTTPGAGDDEWSPPAGARELTNLELKFMCEHGRLPPGLDYYQKPRPIWVEGDVWNPDDVRDRARNSG